MNLQAFHFSPCWPWFVRHALSSTKPEKYIRLITMVFTDFAICFQPLNSKQTCEISHYFNTSATHNNPVHHVSCIFHLLDCKALIMIIFRAMKLGVVQYFDICFYWRRYRNRIGRKKVNTFYGCRKRLIPERHFSESDNGTPTTLPKYYFKHGTSFETTICEPSSLPVFVPVSREYIKTTRE